MQGKSRIRQLRTHQFDHDLTTPWTKNTEEQVGKRYTERSR